VLEGHFDLTVGNARHIRNVPGRKTDVKDVEWIADLVRHGLIAKSFVPPRPLRETRELLRYRRKLTESQAAERNRLLKLLETANIKLASIMSDVFDVSGRAMLRALRDGQASVEAMADLARGQLRRKRHCTDRARGRGGFRPACPAPGKRRIAGFQAPAHDVSAEKLFAYLCRSIPSITGTLAIRTGQTKPRYSAGNHKRVRLDPRPIDRAVPNHQIGSHQDIGNAPGRALLRGLCCTQSSLASEGRRSPC
jgi:hypothetical protein